MMLKDRTIFITGATSGFGRACAEACAREGARLIIAGRRIERLHEFAREVDADVHTLLLDVRNCNAVENAMLNLPRDFHSIDALINNAGLALGLESLEDKPLDDIEQMIDTNIKGLTYCTKAVLPSMVERNAGHIINIGSIAGTYAYPGANVYGATKAYVHQFSLNLRADLIGKNIRVTSIEPGLAETEFSTVRFHGDEEKAADVYKGVQPLQPQDVADAVLWALTRPAHVNINRIELMPVAQAPAALTVARK